MSFDSSDGILKLNYGSADIVRVKHVFWTGDWQWIDVERSNDTHDPGRRHAYRLTSARSGFQLTGTLDTPKDRAPTLRMVAKEAGRTVDAYGGMVFELSLAPLRREGFNPVPKLRDDKRGWSLEIAPGLPPVEFVFDQPIASLHFERDDVNEIRAYIMEKNTRPDEVSAELSITGPIIVKPAATDRLASDVANWPTWDVRWSDFPLDFSFLNDSDRPAGKRGFLRAEGEELVFADGTKARFWGTNISAYALYQANSPQAVQRQARRLARLGFNLVRLHHHDSFWVQPNIFTRGTGNTRTINEDTLARIHWWIKCLRDEGIYVWLDLHVNRRVTSGDGIENFGDIAEEREGRLEAGLFGYAYLNTSIQARMKEFATDYLSRTNPHTGLAPKDDPAVIAILLTNENDLTHHYGNLLIPGNPSPTHSALYMQRAREFAIRHRTDPSATWRSWQPGPSKLFLADLEHQFNRDMIRHLRTIGVKVPIATTNSWGGMGLIGLPSLTNGDIIDVHIYGAPDDVSAKPFFKPTMAAWIAAASVAGKPVTVSEWNVEPFPAFDRAGASPFLAAMAATQEWDAILQYGYTQEPLMNSGSPGNYHSHNDPAFLATLPAAALIFRRGDVQPSERTYYFAASRDHLMSRDLTPGTSRTLRTAPEVAKLRIGLPAFSELPWFSPTKAPSGATVLTDPDTDLLDGAPGPFCISGQAVCRNPEAGTFTIDTARTQLASGWLGGQDINLSGLRLRLDTLNGTVAVQSLDGADLKTSKEILVSLAAQSQPAVRNRIPFKVQPVEGLIEILAAPGLQVSSIAGDGTRRPLDHEFKDGRYLIQLTRATATSWLMLH